MTPTPPPDRKSPEKFNSLQRQRKINAQLRKKLANRDTLTSQQERMRGLVEALESAKKIIDAFNGRTGNNAIDLHIGELLFKLSKDWQKLTEALHEEKVNPDHDFKNCTCHPDGGT